MARPSSILSFALIGLTVLVLATIVPREASAHVSVHETTDVVQVLGVDEPEPHCHGEIECVVTLYPATAEGLVPFLIPTMAHDASRVAVPIGAALKHDPPIPILS